MPDKPKILGLIPARGGSTRLRRKNVRDFAGRPLIAWTIEAARHSRFIDRLILSSEDEEIMNVARRHGCEVPFRRPDALATSESAAIDVVMHALETLEEDYDYLVLLQPTSPLRTTRDIDDCIALCLDNGVSSCVAVSPLPKPWDFLRLIDHNGNLRLLPPHLRPDGRACIVNGAVYIAATSLLREQRSFYAQDTLALEMPPERALDIDEEHEFIMAEALMKQRLAGKNNTDS